jgi:hypothetical protein
VEELQDLLPWKRIAGKRRQATASTSLLWVSFEQ